MGTIVSETLKFDSNASLDLNNPFQSKISRYSLTYTNIAELGYGLVFNKVSRKKSCQVCFSYTKKPPSSAEL